MMSPRGCGWKACGAAEQELRLQPTSAGSRAQAASSQSLAAALGRVTSTACAFSGCSGWTVHSENPVASYLGRVPPGLPEARTSCPVVVMWLWVLLPALCRQPHGWSCLMLISWVQAWPQKWPRGGHGPEARAEAVLGGSCPGCLPLRAECLEAHINVGKCAECVASSCLPVERRAAAHQRVGALLNSYPDSGIPHKCRWSHY